MWRRPCVGILRETKNKWERRVPLVPKHVGVLVNKGIRVLVQPSTRRVFHDTEFIAQGAEITDNLNDANVIFGVKEFPKEQLISDKSYVMFSHVIKAQPYNMPFLDECLKRNVRLFDYEKITSAGEGEEGKKKKGERLVAFGRYAGIAGMIDCLRGIGERLLALGYSTPFLGISSSYMYPTVEAAKCAVIAAGEEIKKVGLPKELGSPFTFVFTGSGRVAQGAMEIFKLLPHEFVDAREFKANIGRYEGQNKLIATIATSESLVESVSGSKFSKQEYYTNPEKYRPVFYSNIAPFTNVLVNCVYWDYRYPRILSKENYRNLLLSKPPHQLIEVADISADIRGSIEFTEKYTSIDDPFFLYDPLSDAIHKDMEGKGALVLAVENLPAEFPKDASEHFSSALFPFVESLASLNAADSFESHLSVLPKEMISACITSNGSLLPEFKYIEKLRIQTEREYNSKAAASDTKSNFNQLIRISGHLFDTGLINQVLDSIEESGNQFKLLHLSVSPNDASSQRTSRVVIQVMSNTESSLKACIQKVSTLCQLIPKAQANFSELPYGALLDSTETGSLRASTHLSSGSSPKVLVLGSGMVSRPLLKYLDHHKISTLLVSNDGVQAEKIASSCVNGFVSPKVLDISDSSALSELMKSSDLKVVMSLLPASMHVQVAQKCLEYSKNLVTSSYVSKEMNALNSLAREKNLCFLNEMGLDPGIDHLSAAKIIHESLKSGKKVKSFESFCGGLPAPEVAAENPFMYKFSWSPKGVFSAMQQSALYKKDSKFVNVKGQDLMTSALPFDELRLMNLEHIPNRDSLVYTPQYGLNIDDMDTMYRATLRYKGFCSLMYVFRLLGFLESNSVTSFVSWKQYLSAQHNCSPSNLLEVLSSKIPEESRHAFFSAISWLKVLDEDVPLNGPTTVDAFCSLLQSRLKYEPAERDMIVLVHRFGISSESGDGEIHTSSLVCYGDPIGDSAMARTVGIPAGIGVKLVLEDSISKKGVITPVISSIYDKALPELAQHGIVFHDKVEKL